MDTPDGIEYTPPTQKEREFLDWALAEAIKRVRGEDSA